jgi:predicted small secreted protein
MLNKKMLAVVAAAACAGLAGCENTAQGVKQDAKENSAAAQQQAADTKAATADERAEAKDDAKDAGAAIKEGANDVGGALKDAGQAVGHAADKAGHAIAGAAKDAGNAASNAAANTAGTRTAEIKSALMADKTVDASRIDVDSDGDTKTVTLKGSVKTAGQKATAGRIAKSKADGYAVRNNLTVG